MRAECEAILTKADVEFLLNLVRHTDWWDEESEAEVKGAEARLEAIWKKMQEDESK